MKRKYERITQNSMETFITSDHHFNHQHPKYPEKCIIGYANRPFENIQQMNQEMKDKWNEVVSPEDLVIYGGDFCLYMTFEEAKKLLLSLNGNKILVMGNHDKGVGKAVFKKCGYTVVKYYPIQIGEYNCVVVHRPVYPGAEKFYKIHVPYPDTYDFFLHGHTHSPSIWHGDEKRKKNMNISVEAHTYYPVHATTIYKHLKKRQ